VLVDTIDPTKTAMIVVDMQNDFVASGAPIEVSAAALWCRSWRKPSRYAAMPEFE
jgi:nicotinamidase-related amidase